MERIKLVHPGFLMPGHTPVTLALLLFHVCLVRSPAALSDYTANLDGFYQSNDPSFCIVLAASDAGAKAAANPALEDRQITTQKTNEELLKSIGRNEMEQFVNAVAAVRSQDGSTWSLGLMLERVDIPFERLGLLFDDIAILLVTHHSRQALARFNNAPLEYKPTALRLKQALEKIEACGQQRFTGRGGISAYNESLRLVVQYQEQLEPVVLLQMAGGLSQRVPR